MKDIYGNDIRSLISLMELYWENDFNTNCYAFAPGLDIPENEICENAYQLGFIGAKEFGLQIKEIKKLGIEERFLLDLKALKIACDETDEIHQATWQYLGNYKCRYWDVLLYSNGENFHFARVNYDGELYHKVGYFGTPIMYKENTELLNGYSLVKKYRLRYWERTENFINT